ncbi:hypothetical protein KCU73_g3016, partial [Aureobasidium melanogenum]
MQKQREFSQPRYNLPALEQEFIAYLPGLNEEIRSESDARSMSLPMQSNIDPRLLTTFDKDLYRVEMNYPVPGDTVPYEAPSPCLKPIQGSTDAQQWRNQGLSAQSQMTGKRKQDCNQTGPDAPSKVQRQAVDSRPSPQVTPASNSSTPQNSAVITTIVPKRGRGRPRKLTPSAPCKPQPRPIMGPPLMPRAQPPTIQGSPDPLAGPGSNKPAVLEMTVVQRESNEKPTTKLNSAQFRPHPVHRVTGEKSALEHFTKQPESTPVTAERQVIRESVETEDHYVDPTVNTAQANPLYHEEEIHGPDSRDTSPSWSIQDIERQTNVRIGNQQLNSDPLATSSGPREQGKYESLTYPEWWEKYLAKLTTHINETESAIQIQRGIIECSRNNLNAMHAKVRVAEVARDTAKGQLIDIQDQANNAKADLAGEEERYKKLLEEKAALEVTLEGKIRKSNRRMVAESDAEKLKQSRWARELTESPVRSLGSRFWSWVPKFSWWN